MVKITLHTHAASGAVSGSVYLDDLTVAEHTHVFDQMDYHDEYLASLATEDAPTLFYYSWTCGEIGTETFSYGEPLPKPEPEETQPEETTPPAPQPTEPPVQNEKSSGIGWIWIVLCGALLLGIVIFLILFTKKRKKSQ